MALELPLVRSNAQELTFELNPDPLVQGLLTEGATDNNTYAAIEQQA